jgi:hypothetical protein
MPLVVITPAPATPLASLAAVKADLGITGAADDAWLLATIDEATAAAAAYCLRFEGFGRATWEQTERLTRIEPWIMLARDLEPAVATVTEDGTALATADYELDMGGLLYRLVDDVRVAWTARKVVIRYDAGFVTIPPGLARAAVDLVVRAYSARGRDPALKSERILDVIAQSWSTGGDAKVSAGGVPKDVAGRLDAYLRLPL